MQSELKCVYCQRSSGALLRLDTVSRCDFAHRECRDEKACGFCGHTGMTRMCSEPGCYRVLHTWCGCIYAPSAPATHCQVHLFGHRLEKYSSLKPVLPRISLNPQLLHTLKRLEGTAAAYCTGHVFWYYIGGQYFPANTNLTRFPDIRKGVLSGNETCEVINQWEVTGNVRVDDLLESVVTALSYNRLKLDTFKREIMEKITKNTLEKVEINSEERAVLAELRTMENKPAHEDYLRYLEGKQRAEILRISSTEQHIYPVSAAADESCAVCGLTTYDEENLLIQCAVTST